MKRRKKVDKGIVVGKSEVEEMLPPLPEDGPQEYPTVFGSKEVDDYPMDAVTAFKPNDWNPNNVPPERFAKMEMGILDTWNRTGVIPPLIVRPLPRGHAGPQRWEIIDGEHRWKVFVKHNIPNIPYLDLGNISGSRARALTSSLNWNRGEPDPYKYTEMVYQMLTDSEDPLSISVASSLLPEDEETLSDMITVFSDQLPDVDVGDILDGMGFDEDEESQNPFDELEKARKDEERSGRGEVEDDDLLVRVDFHLSMNLAAKVEKVRMRLGDWVEDYPGSQSGGLVSEERVDDLLFVLFTKLFEKNITDMGHVFHVLQGKRNTLKDAVREKREELEDRSGE